MWIKSSSDEWIIANKPVHIKNTNSFIVIVLKKVIEFCTEYNKSYHIKDGTIT